ncbi:DNA polymerase III subunit delta' [Lacticaseibacillus baoqingensis]|uniref:DNA polymerase III subunit delta n=1 Tax=Lacticaseibacillus baoqingensis TaxID=2486013 RepID=A0ABW4E8E1_9LACO|nr:DNA polymerase III subunit delta' [Lacticaseibacillus baoqingensis]
MLAIEALQPGLVKQFAAIIAADRLGQAYVFNGLSGTGKGALAQWIALRLFCQNVQAGHPCGECAECQRILSHNHPDVVVLATDARSLKVDDVRELKSELSKSGVEGQTRVFVIEQAEKMTPGAANSLLKFYEEPVSGAVIILTTTAKNQLLPTILSRAQIINFPTPPRAQIKAQLEADGVSARLAAVVAQLTADVADAQSLTADESFQERITRVLKLAEQLANRDATAFVAVQANLLPVAKALPEQTQLLALLALVYEDALNRHFQVAAPAAFAAEPVVAQLAAQSAAALSASLSAILQAQVQLRQNVTFQSDTEQLVLKLLAIA